MQEFTRASTTRHREIFPPGFDSRPNSSASTALASHYIFKSGQLYSSLVENCSHTSLGDSIVVTSAWYGKRTKSTIAHEFILAEVMDKANDLTNYIVIDRNAHNGHPGTTRSQSYSTGCIADDQFRVAYEGKLSKLMQECSFKHYQMLEKIEFSPQSSFYFYELVTLANVVSELYPSYSVADTNCYLYAGLIWECIRRMYPKALYRTDMSGNRGRFVWIRLAPGDDAKEHVYALFQERLLGARQRIDAARRLRERLANELLQVD